MPRLRRDGMSSRMVRSGVNPAVATRPTSRYHPRVTPPRALVDDIGQQEAVADNDLARRHRRLNDLIDKSSGAMYSNISLRR